MQKNRVKLPINRIGKNVISFILTPRADTNCSKKIELFSLEALRNFYPSSELLFYSDDEGISALAEQFNATVAENIEKVDGKPSIFCGLKWAAKTARYDILVYLNSDIVLTNGMHRLVEIISKRFGSRWLMSCQRLNIDYNETVHNLLLSGHADKVLKNSKYHRKSGMDLFAFHKELLLDWTAPELPVGYPGWDSYFISAQRAKNNAVVDCTAAFKMFHQNHNQRYTVNYDDFKKIQQKLGIANLNTLLIANYEITSKFKIKYSFINDVYGNLIARFAIGMMRLLIKFIAGK